MCSRAEGVSQSTSPFSLPRLISPPATQVHPGLLAYRPERLDAQLDALGGALDLPRARVTALARLRPELLATSVAGRVAPALRWLQCGDAGALDGPAARRVGARFPQLFGLDLERNCAPKLRALRDELELDDDEVRRRVP